MYILIKFYKPKKELYHSKDNCPPKERGEGCYGDCLDCYSRDASRYKRLKKYFPEREDKKNKRK